MKERVQNAVIGFVKGTISFIHRASVLSSDLSYYPYFTNETLSNFSETEKFLAFAVNNEKIIAHSTDLSLYDNLPFHLVMAWDQDWNERLAYFRPCRDPNNRTQCDLLPLSEAFADYEKGDFTLIHKDKIPKFFRGLNKTKPYCSATMYNCTGFANIPFEEGGPMIFTMFNVGTYSSVMSEGNTSYPFDNWTFLMASNALLFSEIGANRTGLCTSFYSSTEKNITPYMDEQFQTKKAKKLTLNLAEYEVDPDMKIGVASVESSIVTLEQDYYAEAVSRYSLKQSDRAICDSFYDHRYYPDGMMETASLVYKTFDFDKGVNDDETVAFRFEYHDPITSASMIYANMMVIVLCLIFALVNLCIFLYFNCVFLVPLDRLRRARAELIKNTLSGLEDDNVTKELFGDIVDDSALIEANGDEITVMLTLQERMDALYSNIIKSKIEEVNSARSVIRSELCALRVMNIFMRRDDEALRAILPGLMDPSELVRHYRRANIVVHTPEGRQINKFVTAKRAFRSLKSVLNNSVATQFFKAFCIHRGRSSVNSFFFLMDVSWLHQVESGDRNDQGDFLSAMFSDSGAASPTSPLLPTSFDKAQSSDLLSSTTSSTEDLLAPRSDSARPHHSHFARSRSSSSLDEQEQSQHAPDSPKKESPKIEEEKAKGVVKIPKMPIAKNPSPPSSPIKAANVPQFSSKLSDGIAHFIQECYFGPKSLAQRDLRHAALLGCSQVPDYIQLRDKKDVVYSPIMFDNLVTAVTKKFTMEVLPQFHNSVAFQVMVYALTLTGYFEGQGESSSKEDEESMPQFLEDEVLKGMWLACVSSGPDAKKDEEDSSSDSDSDSDSKDESDDESEEEKGDNNSSPEKDDKPSQPAVEVKQASQPTTTESEQSQKPENVKPESKKPEDNKKEEDSKKDDSKKEDSKEDDSSSSGSSSSSSSGSSSSSSSSSSESD